MSWSEVKYALNSSLGTEAFMSLDKLIPYYIAYQSGINVQEFTTPGSYTLSVPKWANSVKITAAGGGGGGGFSDNEFQGTGGGGGAAILNSIHDVSAIASLTVVVGSGGSAGKTASSPTDAEQGGTTSITELNIVLNGGYGGNYAYNSANNVGGAAGGTGGGAGGKTKSAGSNGIAGSGGTSNASEISGGGGGGSIGSGGDAAVWINRTTTERHGATAGVRGGGGGGGAYTSNYGPAAGGDGYVKLEFLP